MCKSRKKSGNNRNNKAKNLYFTNKLFTKKHKIPCLNSVYYTPYNHPFLPSRWQTFAYSMAKHCIFDGKSLPLRWQKQRNTYAQKEI